MIIKCYDTHEADRLIQQAAEEHGGPLSETAKEFYHQALEKLSSSLQCAKDADDQE